MAGVKKLDLERFKKSLAGYREFAVLVEQATPERRKNLLDQVGQVDKVFLRRALRQCVFFEELHLLDEGILTEILHHTSPKLLSYALYDCPKPLVDHIMKHLNYSIMKETLDEQDKIRKAPSKNFILGAQNTILKIARQLEAKGRFVFELADAPRFHSKDKAHLKLVK